MIRVLHVVTILNAGGLETMLMNYYRSMDRDKVQFDFVVHRKERGVYEDEIEALGGKIYRIKPISLSSLINYNREMKKFLQDHKEYNIVHSHLDTLSALPLRAAKSMNIPVRIAHCHTTAIKTDLKAPIRIMLKRRLGKYANYYFACSLKAGVWLFGAKNKKSIHLLKNAIHASYYIYNAEMASRIKYDLNLNEKFIVGHVGNFSEPKNHSFLIEIFNEIYKINKNACLLLIGEGKLRKNIEKKANKMGIKENIIFLGYRNDVAQLLQTMDIFLFPSLYEGLPVSLIEAQASGLKCIVSDTISKEVDVTNEIEYLSLEESPKVWAERIEKYFSGYNRRNTYQEVVNAGYDIKNSALQLQNFYLELAGRYEP